MFESPPGRLLVISTRRIGDVLFTTPLLRTFKHHWPQAKIDALVFKGTESILCANKDVHDIITIEESPKFINHYRLVKKIFRAYDLSVSTLPGDKPTLYAFLSAKRCVGMLDKGKSRWWKSLLLWRFVEFDNISTHTVLMNLRLAEFLGLTIIEAKVVLNWEDTDIQRVSQCIDLSRKLAILHTQPRFSYKAWVTEGWNELANWLQRQGYTIILTGDSTEQVNEMTTDMLSKLHGETIINMIGQLSLNQIAFLLHYIKIYIGPDTVVTHMAAAAGVLTIALFGPTNPVKWGPWPKYWPLLNPFTCVGSQHRNNVYLIQGPGPCVPCFKEGCDQHIKSLSRCLRNLTARQVIDRLIVLMNLK